MSGLTESPLFVFPAGSIPSSGAGRIDPRVHDPDETCAPFLLEAMGTGSTTDILFLFVVPSGHVALIASWVCSEWFDTDTKRIALLFKEGHGDIPLATEQRIPLAAPIHGALLNVIERGSLPGVFHENVAGIYQASAEGSGRLISARPGRISLSEGPWTVYKSIDNLPSGQIQVSLFGWVYPVKGR